MAEPEESPSSLAELEALAGLDGTPAPSPEDAAADADPADFDLSRLAASAAVGASGSDTSADDERLDLGGAGHAAASHVATHASDSVLERAAPDIAAATASAKAAPTGARGLPGFALGLLAGVAGAGVLFLLLRAPTPVTVESPAVTPPATTASSDGTKRDPTPSTAIATPAPADRASTAGASTAAAASATLPPAAPVVMPRAVGTSRPTTTSPTPSAAQAASATDDGPDVDDPTRPPSAPAAEEAPAAPSRPIDSLLDDALGPGKGAKQAKAAQDNLMGQELPATPTAADVTQVIQVLLPAIRGCAMGQSGVANTLLVVRNDGGVASASISGSPYAGAASGRCMEGVLRRAKFPRFRQSVFRVQFPLSIRASS